MVSLVRADILRIGNEETAARSGENRPAGESGSGSPFSEDPAGDQPDAAPTQIALLCEWFELDSLAATRLLDGVANGWCDAAPLRRQLVEMVDGGEATLLESAYVATRSRTAGQIRVGQPVRLPDRDGPARDPPEPECRPIHPGAQIKTHLSYTAFETRNVGTTAEVDPVIGPDGVTLDVNLAPEIVRLGATRFTGQRESRVDVPVFYTIKTSTAVTTHDGVPVLIGMHSPMPDDVTVAYFGSNWRVFTILTARVLEVD